jgi:phosphopantothenoylcysteine decarboxylase/phosphopantothenate--cysteine ligase
LDLPSATGLSGRHIVVGISGGIAAYKSAELVRLLRQADAEVRVVMTAAATEFITPLTLQALSGNPVHTTLLDTAAEAAMGHIELARWADAVLVAPASANCLARLAYGMADDLLSTLCLATEAPLFVAPAMNRVMWAHPATQANCELLQQRGVILLGPAEGDLACGETGAGRMLEAAELVDALCDYWQQQGPLRGTCVLVTAGPTREAIDPVRYISNHSSGKMGYAVAAAAGAAGAEVILVSGPTQLPVPPGVNRIDVESAAQMAAAVQENVARCQIFISVAAVADYRPVAVAQEKIKKRDTGMDLALERTDDILAAVATAQPRPFTVGFAAETHNLERYARDKLQQKGLDMIAANLVGGGLGFDADENALTIIWPDGQRQIERADKTVVAKELIEVIAERYHAKSTS